LRHCRKQLRPINDLWGPSLTASAIKGGAIIKLSTVVYFNLLSKRQVDRLFEFSKIGFSSPVTDSLVAPPAPAMSPLVLIYALIVDK